MNGPILGNFTVAILENKRKKHGQGSDLRKHEILCCNAIGRWQNLGETGRFLLPVLGCSLFSAGFWRLAVIEHSFKFRAKLSLTVIVTINILVSLIPAHAKGARPTVCNSTFHEIVVTTIRSDTRHPKALLADVYREDGWFVVRPAECRRLDEMTIGWGAFAFATRHGNSITPFVYTPSRQYGDGGDAPRFSSVCTNRRGLSFERRGVEAHEVGTSCADGADSIVPISFKINVGIFTDIALTINIDAVPGLGQGEDPNPPEPKLSAAQINLSAWTPYIQQCIPDLIDRYARTEKNAVWECTCYATMYELSVVPERHSYSYPGGVSMEFDSLPIAERDSIRDYIHTCRRLPNYDKDFEAVVTTLMAPYMPKPDDPATLQYGEYLGMTGPMNGRGPLTIRSVEPNSVAANSRLKPGDIIHRVHPHDRVTNLTDLSATINAKLQQNKTEIILSIERSGGYSLIYLNFGS